MYDEQGRRVPGRLRQIDIDKMDPTPPIAPMSAVQRAVRIAVVVGPGLAALWLMWHRAGGGQP